jgi:hypothetical protein
MNLEMISCVIWLKKTFERREAWCSDSRPRGRGFEYWMDAYKRFANYYIKEKLKIKVAKWGTPKKYLKKQKNF